MAAVVYHTPIDYSKDMETDFKAETLPVRLTEQSYRLKTILGKGTFGTVTLARTKSSNKLVAVKTLKGCSHINPLDLREVQFFQNVTDHPSLVNITDMYVDSLTREVNFVLELMEFNMLDLIHARRGSYLEPTVIASVCTQLLQGIAHMHSLDFVHRDIKPENLLLGYHESKQGVKRLVVKIADFGLSRKISSYDHNAVWTGYVATRWYRSPEQLLQVPSHGFALDIWAFGVVLVELCNLQPLFPGKDVYEMLNLQLETLGNPSSTNIGGAWPQVSGSSAENVVNMLRKRRVSGCTNLIKSPSFKVFDKVALACLRWDSRRRPSPENLLHYLRAHPCGTTLNPTVSKSENLAPRLGLHGRSHSIA